MVFPQLGWKSKLQRDATRKGRKNMADGALWGFGRSTSGWVGAWVSWAWRALGRAGLRFDDCVAAPAGLNGG